MVPGTAKNRVLEWGNGRAARKWPEKASPRREYLAFLAAWSPEPAGGSAEFRWSPGNMGRYAYMSVPNTV
jgi:hypothetical protein